MPATARVVGIDPGLRLTGYAVLQLPPDHASPTTDPALLEAGVLRLKTKRSLEERLAQLDEELGQLLDEHKPSFVAVEQLFSHYNHPRTAILMGHARGVILLAAAKREIPVAHLEPTAVKRAVTGYGQANKKQIQETVAGLFGLAEIPEPPDVADAMAIALTHARRLTLDRGRQVNTE